MEKATPSKGPWSYDKEHGDMTFFVFNPDNYIIARHINSTPNEAGQRTVEEAETNARLICAAHPMYELLQALDTFVRFYKEEHGVNLSAYEVFAKARYLRNQIEGKGE